MAAASRSSPLRSWPRSMRPRRLAYQPSIETSSDSSDWSSALELTLERTMWLAVHERPKIRLDQVNDSPSTRAAGQPLTRLVS